jgi:serine/threonine-protein kinase
MLVLADTDEDPLIGSTVDGRYLVQSMLGQGGMGAVYKAHQKTMNRSIALKVLKKELSSDPQIRRNTGLCTGLHVH